MKIYKVGVRTGFHVFYWILGRIQFPGPLPL
ncbi:rCG59050 [Rattus norvegicus]|uniref:RCG59050 n=1 Tax=Rattus norvegicus TaxID=10116 RepID=A6JPS1_RAT|nr:rCG59050 [Rattus norvegicus]